MIAFSKYHGLGNDYLVSEPAALETENASQVALAICNRHYGVGSDGLLVGPFPSAVADFRVRIYNPDGSEAEKSGNGLRIFARYLWDNQRVAQAPFSVETLGGVVRCQVSPDGGVVSVQMGRVDFFVQEGSLAGPEREAIVRRLVVEDLELDVCALSLGNPHCVVLNQVVTPNLAQRLGPRIERHSSFPRRTNVQFLEVIDRQNLRIEIWERGAGYTLASGSSACAAASAAYRLGWCDVQVAVHMPGGQLLVAIGADGMVTLQGPVQRICSGQYWYTVRVPSSS